MKLNKNDEFMGLQKLFVFKSKSSDIIIMLQVNYSGSNNTLCSSNSNDYEKVNEELMSFSNKLINFLVK